MENKWIIIRIEDLFYRNKEWNNLYLSEHRKVLNSITDLGYKISLISSMDMNRLLEIKNNLFIDNSCYLIGYNGGQIYNCSTSKFLEDNVFSESESRMFSQVINRITFDEVGKVSVKVFKSDGEIKLISNQSASYIKDKDELNSKGIDFLEVDSFEPDKNISCISFSLDNKNNINHIFNLLKKYNAQFSCFFVNSNTVNIYPLEATAKSAIEKINKKDKEYKFSKEDIVSIGYTYSDIELFEATGYNICNEESPDALKKLSEFTYVGELSKLISVSLREKFLK